MPGSGGIGIGRGSPEVEISRFTSVRGQDPERLIFPEILVIFGLTENFTWKWFIITFVGRICNIKPQIHLSDDFLIQQFFRSKKFKFDRLVALSYCSRIFSDEDRPIALSVSFLVVSISLSSKAPNGFSGRYLFPVSPHGDLDVRPIGPGF